VHSILTKICYVLASGPVRTSDLPLLGARVDHSTTRPWHPNTCSSRTVQSILLGIQTSDTQGDSIHKKYIYCVTIHQHVDNVQLYTHTGIRVYQVMNSNGTVHNLIYTCKHCMYEFTSMNMCTYTHKCTSKHEHIHTRTRVHTHTYKCMNIKHT